MRDRLGVANFTRSDVIFIGTKSNGYKTKPADGRANAYIEWRIEAGGRHQRSRRLGFVEQPRQRNQILRTHGDYASTRTIDVRNEEEGDRQDEGQDEKRPWV